MMISAPAAAARALSLGQPSRGRTGRSALGPKLAMALAESPIFSPSCGAIRITAGAIPEGPASARYLGVARALGFGRSHAALAFIIGTRCYRDEQAAMVSRKRERYAFKYPAGDFQ